MSTGAELKDSNDDVDRFKQKLEMSQRDMELQVAYAVQEAG